MRVETIKYVDYEGKERCEDFYFNLNKAELAEMQLSGNGDMAKTLSEAIEKNDMPTLVKFLKTLVLKSYGVKSEDGRRFIKSEKLSEEFAQTEAYSELFYKLLSDGEYTTQFINQVIPNVGK